MTDFKEYLQEPLNLQTILEDLGAYCFLNGIDPAGIRVILPKKAIEFFSAGFRPIERIKTSEPELDTTIKSLHSHSGVIHLHSVEDNQETIKALK